MDIVDEAKRDWIAEVENVRQHPESQLTARAATELALGVYEAYRELLSQRATVAFPNRIVLEQNPTIGFSYVDNPHSWLTEK